MNLAVGEYWQLSGILFVILFTFFVKISFQVFKLLALIFINAAQLLIKHLVKPQPGLYFALIPNGWPCKTIFNFVSFNLFLGTWNASTRQEETLYYHLVCVFATFTYLVHDVFTGAHYINNRYSSCPFWSHAFSRTLIITLNEKRK